MVFRKKGRGCWKSNQEGVPERGKEAREVWGKFTLLIFGGSQGAHSINRTALDSLKYLNGIKDKLKIVHQTGDTDFEWVTEVYADCGMDADIFPFIDDGVGLQIG